MTTPQDTPQDPREVRLRALALSLSLEAEEAVTGPSTAALIGHHLTEAIKHLSAAAELSRKLTREDARELSTSLSHMVEAIRDARGDVEGPKS